MSQGINTKNFFLHYPENKTTWLGLPVINKEAAAAAQAQVPHPTSPEAISEKGQKGLGVIVREGEVKVTVQSLQVKCGQHQSLYSRERVS